MNAVLSALLHTPAVARTLMDESVEAVVNTRERVGMLRPEERGAVLKALGGAYAASGLHGITASAPAAASAAAAPAAAPAAVAVEPAAKRGRAASKAASEAGDDVVLVVDDEEGDGGDEADGKKAAGAAAAGSRKQSDTSGAATAAGPAAPLAFRCFGTPFLRVPPVVFGDLDSNIIAAVTTSGGDGAAAVAGSGAAAAAAAVEKPQRGGRRGRRGGAAAATASSTPGATADAASPPTADPPVPAALTPLQLVARSLTSIGAALPAGAAADDAASRREKALETAIAATIGRTALSGGVSLPYLPQGLPPPTGSAAPSSATSSAAAIVYDEQRRRRLAGLDPALLRLLLWPDARIGAPAAMIGLPSAALTRARWAPFADKLSQLSVSTLARRCGVFVPSVRSREAPPTQSLAALGLGRDAESSGDEGAGRSPDVAVSCDHLSTDATLRSLPLYRELLQMARSKMAKETITSDDLRRFKKVLARYDDTFAGAFGPCAQLCCVRSARVDCTTIMPPPCLCLL